MFKSLSFQSRTIGAFVLMVVIVLTIALLGWSSVN